MYALATIGLALALAACAWIDIATRRLPDLLTLPLIAVGLAYSAFSGWQVALLHLLAAALGFAAFYLIAHLYLGLKRQHGLGLGDAKLLAAAGAWLGPIHLGPVVLLSTVLALAFVLALRVIGLPVSWQTTIPFGPFLAAGFFVLWCIMLAGGQV